MTRKEFEAIAEALAEVVPANVHGAKVKSDIIRSLTTTFKLMHPKFDSEKFRDNCFAK